MNEILYTDFESIESIMDEMIKNNPVLKKAVKRSVLYKFWKKIVGKPFDEKSKPFGMAGANTMIIACETSSVVQELTLRKKQLIEQYAPYVKSLNIELKDMRFDVKKWDS